MITPTQLKYVALLESLYGRTEAGSTTWSKSSSDEVFSTPVGKYTIHIDSRVDYYDAPNRYEITIYTNTGDRVETFGDGDLREIPPALDSFNSYTDLLAELHRRAGREASGAERVLDELLLTLGTKPAEPARPKKPMPVENFDLDDEIPF